VRFKDGLKFYKRPLSN